MEDKRQDVIPYPRVGRTSWNLTEDKRQDVIPYPRVGRTSWNLTEDKRQDVIPYPRVGRTSWNLTEDKRQGLIPFPRIGRTSRNMTEDKQRVLVPFPQVDQSEEKDLQLALIPRQVIPSPRFGRSFTSGIGRHVSVWPDSLVVQQDGDKRSFFTPRIGITLFTPRIYKTDIDSDSNIPHIYRVLNTDYYIKTRPP
ncbi:uncharacterized protein LOC106460811 [Limulus polyphemus]|uniref:Uncharacterized protein LOC106460811 n=1 Tax=Limulus polyphemus TaxID=6850 RepID=A0ABM1SI59_LIMPO|nr:uncharacterized protein LOC106460811 [Limulus polyphemus]